MYTYLRYITFFIITTSSFHVFPLEQIRVQGASSDVRFPVTILRDIIARGKKYELVFVADEEAITESKLHNDVFSGAIDLLWTLSKPEYEERFETLFIPLYRGMLGMRIAIVRQDKKSIFADVHSLDDLHKFKAGQGRGWGDVAILEYNTLNVVQTMKYENLFPMLEGGRFDYFPRGVPEPWSEIIREEQYNLTVEPHILFKYTAPFYFFATPGNKELIGHLRENLEAMIADGSFQKAFFAHPDIKDALSMADLKNRRVIELENPGLTKEAPLDRPELWFDPTQ